MANNPKRIQDPTEAAMSAIQEALNLREEPPARAAETAPPSAPAPDPFANIAEQAAPARKAAAALRAARPPIDEDLFLQETVGRALARADLDEVKPIQRAANDDRQSVGQVLPVAAEAPLARALCGRVLPLRHLGGARPAGRRLVLRHRTSSAIARRGVAPDAVRAGCRHRAAGAASSTWSPT